MSREYRGKRVVIYPVYFDRNYPRGKWRRVPIKLAVSNPTIEKIVEACRKLNLNPEIEPEKTFPGYYGIRGRVIVDKIGSKLKTIYLIASKLKELEK